MARKKPQPDLVIRMVGPGLKPWLVPMRSLTRTLQAVQSLMEAPPGDWYEPEEIVEKESEAEGHEDESKKGDSALFLLDVISKSATYPVGTHEPQRALQVLRNTGEAIADPESAKWSPEMLYPVRSLSEVASALGCQIEFRMPGEGRQMGDVIATIGPATFWRIAESAFVCGDTSVYGKIERVGGATEMRCALRVPEQPSKMIYCSVASQDLARDLGQYLYQHVVVTGRATWFRRDWRLRKIDIVSFEPPKKGSILDALDKIHDAGGYVWDKIEDPAAFLTEQRG